MLVFLAEAATETQPLIDLVRANPQNFFLGCVVWIPVAIWVISMVSWMILGEIDAIFGTAAIGLALTLGFMTTNPVDPKLTPFFFMAVISMIAVWPFLKAGANARIEWIAKVDEIERAYDRLDMAPKDPGALFKLAVAVRHFGMEGPSIVMGENATRRLDPKYFRDQINMVHHWKTAALDPDLMAETTCPGCRLKNGPGIPFCPRCGERQYLSIANQFWRPQSFGIRILGAWVAGLSAAVLAPIVASSPWPVAAKVISITGLVTIGGFILVRMLFLMAKEKQI